MGYLRLSTPRNMEKTRELIMIPRDLIHEILETYHDNSINGAHSSTSKTFQKIKQKFYWDKMYSDIEHWVKSCDVCR